MWVLMALDGNPDETGLGARNGLLCGCEPRTRYKTRGVIQTMLLCGCSCCLCVAAHGAPCVTGQCGHYCPDPQHGNFAVVC